MKVLIPCAFCALMCMGLVGAAAQAPATSEPAASSRLFSDLPDSILLEAAKLDRLLEQTSHTAVRIELAPDFFLQGKIVSAAHDKEAGLSSVVLRASNRLGAVFTLSRITDENGHTGYSGSILSRAHSDAYELVEASGRYYLVKRSQNELVEE